MSDDQARSDDPRVASRAELLPEERAAGSDDPEAQAKVILEESDERTLDRSAAPGTTMEHRSSEDTVDPVDAPTGGTSS